METQIINTIQLSFKKLKPVGTTTTAYFYYKLIEFDPELKNKYSSKKADTILSLTDNFMSFLSTTISNLDNYKELIPVLKNLGLALASSNLKPTFYDHLGTAFMASLAKNLKENFTLEVELAWLSFYNTITQTMRSATI
jgi:hemoglobin-like flavoprotein